MVCPRNTVLRNSCDVPYSRPACAEIRFDAKYVLVYDVFHSLFSKVSNGRCIMFTLVINRHEVQGFAKVFHFINKPVCS